MLALVLGTRHVYKVMLVQLCKFSHIVYMTMKIVKKICQYSKLLKCIIICIVFTFIVHCSVLYKIVHSKISLIYVTLKMFFIELLDII